MDTVGWADIGTCPQLPLPPLMILLAKVSITAGDAVYFLATSVNAGPITFSFTLWQVIQSFFAIKPAPAVSAAIGAVLVTVLLVVVSVVVVLLPDLLLPPHAEIS